MKKILVIEDQPNLRDNLASLLALEGFAVAVAEDGLRGVAEALRDPPDLILCDVTMPGMDGHGVLAELRQHASTSLVPFIFLTAKGGHGDVRQGMNNGADDYLVKPAGRDELLASITARLERQEREAARARELASQVKPDFSSAAPLVELGLTPREAEVLLWVAQGKSNPDISVILGMSEATVKKHLQNLFAKLGVENRHAATRLAVERLGMVS